MEQWRKRVIWKTKVSDNQFWNNGIFWSNKLTTLRTEASFHEGLSSALFQKEPLRQQLIHFICRRLSDIEKIYSQTVKDMLAVKWAVTRLRNHLIGVHKFTIKTVHKPLISKFNKVNARLPLRIEKWTMEITDFDFELEYEPGFNELYSSDYISKHSIWENRPQKKTEQNNHILHKENSEILDRIKIEKEKDNILRKSTSHIINIDWIKAEKDVDMLPYKHIKEEICIIEGIVYNRAKIIIPNSLQNNKNRTLPMISEKIKDQTTTKRKILVP